MLKGESGWLATPLFTVGDTIGSGDGAYRPMGKLDGNAHYQLNETTVRLLVNHESSAVEGPLYSVSNGGSGLVSLTGARIDYFDIDVTTMSIKSAGQAIKLIHNRGGDIVVAAGDLEDNGFTNFCSSVLVGAQEFGANRGIADSIYFTGEEKALGAGGTEWALDIATGELWAVPDFGRGKWENVAQVDTGDEEHVAFLLGDDTPGAALYMYVGSKVAGGDFLARNGLRDGQLYVWAANGGELTAANFASGSRTGTWKPIATRDVAMANTEGFDALGYKTAIKLATDADSVGAFSFARVEDIDRDPFNTQNFSFAVTGNTTFDGGSNTAGMIHTVSVDFSDVAAPTATVSVLHNANTAVGQPIRSPDNLEWSADGWIYVQEDKSADIFTPTSPNTHESSILRINALTGDVERVAVINRGAVEPYFTDTKTGVNGAWESTGIIDVSESFGKPAGTLFIANVMSHGVDAGGLLEGGQMVLLSKAGHSPIPGVSLSPVENCSTVIGSTFADRIIGNGDANSLSGRQGNDRIYGGSGNDVIYGGAGTDKMSGDYGADRYGYNDPTHGGDYITYFSSIDHFVFRGSAFGLGTFKGTLPGYRLQARDNNHAVDANDRFIFRKGDDTLWFDADGNGALAPVLIADIGNNFGLVAGDILIA